MKIRTTKEIKDFWKQGRDNWDIKKWVAVDDLLRLINKLEREGCNSGSGFSSYKLKESLKQKN